MEIMIEAVPVAGRGGSEGCEVSRLPHFLHGLLTDGGGGSEHYAPTAFEPEGIPGARFSWRLG